MSNRNESTKRIHPITILKWAVVLTFLVGCSTSQVEESRPATTRIDAGRIDGKKLLLNPWCYPDLAVEEFSVHTQDSLQSPATTVRQCQEVFIKEVISVSQNRANQSVVQLYFSRTPNPCWDSVWTSHDLSAFDGFDKIEYAHSARIPADAIPGNRYYIIATVGHGVDEGPHDRSNNVSIAYPVVVERSSCSQELAIGGGNSDLVPHANSWVSNTNPGRGTSIYIYSITTNQVSGSASSSTTKIYLSPSSTIPPSESYYWYSHSVPVLAGFKSTTNISYKTVPTSLGAGTHYLIAKCASPGGSECSTCAGNNIQVIETLTLQ